jgi:hypothetical protein
MHEHTVLSLGSQVHGWCSLAVHCRPSICLRRHPQSLSTRGCVVQVRACGEESIMFKRVLVESDKWEVARAPNEVRAATKHAAQALLTAAQPSVVQLCERGPCQNMNRVTPTHAHTSTCVHLQCCSCSSCAVAAVSRCLSAARPVRLPMTAASAAASNSSLSVPSSG